MRDERNEEAAAIEQDVTDSMRILRDEHQYTREDLERVVGVLYPDVPIAVDRDAPYPDAEIETDASADIEAASDETERERSRTFDIGAMGG